MAQIDSSIALGFRPTTQVEQPLNTLARLLQAQGLQQQNQLGQMKMDEYRSGVERKNKLMELYGMGGSEDETVERLNRAGFREEASKILKDRQTYAKGNVELDEKRFKLANDRFNTYRSTLGALSQRPDLSKDMVLMAGQELVNAGVIPADIYQKALATIPDDPNQLRQRLREGVAAQMAPDKMLEFFAPKVEKIDSGQQILFRDTNPNSPTFGQATGGAPVQKMQTPDSIASNETTRRGQNMVDARARERLEFDKSKPAKAAGGGNATEGERKAATLLARMDGSLKQLESVLQKNPDAAKPGMLAEGLRAMPIFGGDTPANIVTPEARQRVEAAQLDILDAALTLGTGAAYTKEQLQGYRKSYFPQIGDDANTVKDKQDRLNNVLQAARIAAGRAAPAEQAPVDDESAGLPSSDAIEAEIRRRAKAKGGR
jgi:hypothetical protein